MKTKTRAQNGTRSAHAHQLARGWENLVHHDQKNTGKISLGNYWIFLTLVIKSYWKISLGNHWAFLKFFIKKLLEDFIGKSLSIPQILHQKITGRFHWKVLSIPHGEITDRCHLRKIFGVEGQRKHCRKSYEDSNTIKLSWTSAQVPGNTRLK